MNHVTGLHALIIDPRLLWNALPTINLLARSSDVDASLLGGPGLSVLLFDVTKPATAPECVLAESSLNPGCVFGQLHGPSCRLTEVCVQARDVGGDWELDPNTCATLNSGTGYYLALPLPVPVPPGLEPSPWLRYPDPDPSVPASVNLN